jgi:osmotically inducible protein OsmC
MLVIRKAWAVWEGGIKHGGGRISTETGVLKEAPYACFSMALSLMLGEAGLKPARI